MHCKGHSREGSKVAEGNQLADCQARKAALYETPSLQTPLIWTGPVEQEKTQYAEEEWKDMKKEEQRLLIKDGYMIKDGYSLRMDD